MGPAQESHLIILLVLFTSGDGILVAARIEFFDLTMHILFISYACPMHILCISYAYPMHFLRISSILGLAMIGFPTLYFRVQHTLMDGF